MMNKKKTSLLLSMKYFLVVPFIAGLLLTNCSNAHDGQDGYHTPETKGQNSVEKIIIDHTVASAEKSEKDLVFVTAEQMPSYQGGEEAMQEFIRTNVNYPVTAQNTGTQGRVIVRFVVSRNGEVKNATILRGIDPECDREALRVVKEMPKWNPGKQNGESVDTYFTLPIVFKLK